MNNDEEKLKNNINRILNLNNNNNNKHAREAILYSLVAVWINHNEAATYHKFCEIVKSNSSDLITFDDNVTDFTNATYHAVVDARDAARDAATCAARDAATCAARDAATCAAALDDASRAYICASRAVSLAYQFGTSSPADAALYYLIAAYLCLM